MICTLAMYGLIQAGMKVGKVLKRARKAQEAANKLIKEYDKRYPGNRK